MGPVQGIFLVTEYRSLRRRSTKFRAASIVAPYFPGWRGQCLAIPGTVIWGLWLSTPSRLGRERMGHPEACSLFSSAPARGFPPAGFQLLVGRHVHPVDLVVVRLADARLILDPQMAGRAGAHSAAGVIEKDVIVLSNVKKRHRLAVMFIRHGAEFEFNRFALGEKGDAHQLLRGNCFSICFAHRIPSFLAVL